MALELLDAVDVRDAGTAVPAVVLRPELASAREARRYVRRRLAAAGMAEELVEAAELVVSELTTNAVLHGGSEIILSCDLHGGCVHLSVGDGSWARPGVRCYDAAATTGRGMELVEALVVAWGVEEHPNGKTVWAELGDCPQGGEPTGGSPAKQIVMVRFLNLPVGLVRETLQHSDALLREVAIATLSDGRTWKAPSLDLTALIDTVAAALASGATHVDVDVDFRTGSSDAALERLALVEHAEATLAPRRRFTERSRPDITACRSWLYRQIGLQPGGMRPEPWRG